MKKNLFTPIAESWKLEALTGVGRVSLKLESAQATGSFKDRGMQALCQHHKVSGVQQVVSSSGGNAGLAAAFNARKLGMQALVIVPKTTKPMMLDKIRAVGAQVEVFGENWNEADSKARKLCEEDRTYGYVPPFDHKVLWQGHSSLVDELYEQRDGKAPDYIFASVGGGGLLAGILHGLARKGGEWATKTKVVAAETEGAASMAAALKAGKPVPIERISSIATSLGALQVSQDALDLALSHPAGCESVVVDDKAAIRGCLILADYHRVLCEPACGTVVGAFRAKFAGMDEKLKEQQDVVLVVCGGSAINMDLLHEYKTTFGIEAE